MTEKFIQKDIREIKESAVEMIGYEWFLLTAGTIDNFNTMTAAWGGLGFLWKKPVVYCFIRPTRHTYQFFENNDKFSVCFFDKTFKEVLNYCGSHSGRDVDKIKQTGLIPIEGGCGTIIFEQARLALECKKIYFDDIKPAHFLDKGIDKLYNKDYHRMYIGEIISCLVKQ